MLCKCLLNNRTRASIQILEEILGATRSDRIYVAEQVTPLFVTLAKRFPKLIGSEYLAAKVPFGACDERAVRNDSVTKLTFQDNSFHYVLNFDVLEHIPNPEEGLREIHPVLARRQAATLGSIPADAPRNTSAC